MKYNAYSADGANIITAEVTTLEIECQCGALWLHDTVKTTSFICPYCNAGGEPYLDTEHLTVEQSTRSTSYGRDLRGIARSLWAGVIDEFQAYELLQGTIRIGLTNAATDGSAECGIAPNEWTPEERQILEQAIYDETFRIDGLIDFIQQNNKDSGSKLATVLARVDLWTLRYDDVAGRFRILTCANQKGKWVQGPTSDRCDTCTSMNNKVKRFSYWAEKGPHPKAPPNPTIQCQGWRCQCEILPTDEPLSKGPLPMWP